MIRIARIRTALAALVLGGACALPLSHGMAPQSAHAAAAHQSGGVLGGTWLNFTKGARFSDLQIQVITTSKIGAAVPTSITYAVSVFSLTANRYVAFGVAAPVPFTAAETATVTLGALPTPSRLLVTTLTLSQVDASTIRVAIRDHSPLVGDRFSVEYMHR
jgi:hypothetical protein